MHTETIEPPLGHATIIEAALVADSPSAESPIGPVRRGWRLSCSAIEWLFGAAALVIGLAVLASIPIVQFVSLGYLLECSGRIVRTGRLRAGLIGMRKAARAGGIALGTALVLAPVAAIAQLARSARLIDPGGRNDAGLSALLIAALAIAVVQIASACWRGGRIRNFLWPAPIATARFLAGLVTSNGTCSRASDASWRYIKSLQLPYYFSLGLRGAIGGLAWLFIPVTLLIAGMRGPTPPLGIAGAAMFAIVLLYLPFVQTRFAAENRLRAMFQIGPVRQVFRRAPLAFLISLVVTLGLAVPLFLLKVQLIPRDAVWLACLFFVVFTWPAKLLLGWSYAYGQRRPRPRNFVLRWLMRLAMVPIAAAYVGLMYLTMYTSWYGMVSIYAQHPFLVPVPFLTVE